MSKTVKEIIISVVLVIILGLVLFNSFKGRGKKKSATPQKLKALSDILPSLVTPVKTPSLTVADKEMMKSLEARAQSIEWGRDPFKYTAIEGGRGYHAEALLLKGVSLGEDKTAFAFINDEIVKVGDIVGGHEVVNIQEDKVLLKRGSQIFYLTLPEESF